MSEEPFFEIKNPFTARLTSEGHQLFQESLIDIVPDKEAKDLNNRIILDRLIELAISKGRKIFVQRPEDAAAIQNLTTENGQLKTSIEFLNKEIYKLDKMYSEKTQLAIALETELNGKIDEVENIKTAVPDPMAIVLMFPEKAKTLLNLACSRIAQRTKQEVTPDLLLWDLFWDYVRGIADHKYPFVIKSSDLKEPKHE